MAPGRAVWGGGRRRSDGESGEDVVVRQYRYLLATATVDALEGIHAEVVSAMSQADRIKLLRGLSEAFATGRHLSPDDVEKVAHLIAVGGQRHPRAWINSLDLSFARQLAQGALDAEASFGRLNGYAQWDGTSAEPVEETGPNDGFNPSPRLDGLGLHNGPQFKDGRGIAGGG